MGLLQMLNPVAALASKVGGNMLDHNNMMGNMAQAFGRAPSQEQAAYHQRGMGQMSDPGLAAPQPAPISGYDSGMGAMSDAEHAGWTAAQERQARAAGFPSAQAAVDWERHRQEHRPQQTVTGQSTEGDNVRGGQVVHPGGGNAMAWHPASIFNWVASILHGANNPQQ